MPLQRQSWVDPHCESLVGDWVAWAGVAPKSARARMRVSRAAAHGVGFVMSRYGTAAP